MNCEKIIFPITCNKKLAKEVSRLADIPLGRYECWHFSDGEFIVKSLEEVAGKDVYIIQSTARSASENLMQILIFIDGLKRSAAKSINVIIPYYGFSRQDKILHDYDPITASLVGDLLKSAGATSVYTIDMHTPRTFSAYALPAYNISSTNLFADYYKGIFTKNHVESKNITVFSPDHGSENRGHKLANLLGAEFGEITKRRPSANKAEIVAVEGKIKDQYVVIIDDIIDTGGTMIEAIYAIKESGAKKVYVAATHPVLSKGAIELLLKSPSDDIVFTDTITKKHPKKVHVLSVAKIIADVIK